MSETPTSSLRRWGLDPSQLRTRATPPTLGSHGGGGGGGGGDSSSSSGVPIIVPILILVAIIGVGAFVAYRTVVDEKEREARQSA